MAGKRGTASWLVTFGLAVSLGGSGCWVGFAERPGRPVYWDSQDAVADAMDRVSWRPVGEPAPRNPEPGSSWEEIIALAAVLVVAGMD